MVRVNADGYTYSGLIQPVETLYHEARFDIPASGLLGEITVPFSDTRLKPSILSRRGYRLYHGSLHWITGVSVNAKEKGIWYKIYDRLLQKTFYASSYDLRPISPSELEPLSGDIPEADNHVHVDGTTQTVTAFGIGLGHGASCSVR